MFCTFGETTLNGVRQLHLIETTNLKIIAGSGVKATLLDNEDSVHECVVGDLSIMPKVAQSVFNKKLLEIPRDAKKYVFLTVNEDPAAIAILD